MSRRLAAGLIALLGALLALALTLRQPEAPGGMAPLPVDTGAP